MSVGGGGIPASQRRLGWGGRETVKKATRPPTRAPDTSDRLPPSFLPPPAATAAADRPTDLSAKCKVGCSCKIWSLKGKPLCHV
jgi:hypothetical protein